MSDDFDFSSEYDSTDDDILESYDDGASPVELSLAEQDRKQDEYIAKTKQYMRMIVKPKQFNKQQRLEALRWLGESGNPDAIPALVKVYKKDKTPGMKEEAAYALGQFKALDIELKDPEIADETLERINSMVLYDKYGERKSALLFILGEVALVVLAIILLAFGSVLAARNAQERALFTSQTQTAMPTATPDSEDAVQNDVGAYYAALESDANFFQQQLAAVSRGEALNCNMAFIERPDTYTLTTTWENDPTYSSVVTQLNDIRTEFDQVYIAHANSCNSGIAMARQEAIDLGGVVISVQQSLNTAFASLNQSGIEVTEQVFATSTPAPTDTPNPDIPTPTEDISNLVDTISILERIVFDMTELGGPASQIEFNWQQVLTNGEIYRSGCNQPEPLIPEDYILSAELAEQSPSLVNAVDNVNLGLQSVRLSTTAFYEACTAGTIPDDAQGRLSQAQLALTAFESATIDLNAISGR